MGTQVRSEHGPAVGTDYLAMVERDSALRDEIRMVQRSKLQKQLNDYLDRMEDLKLRQAELKAHHSFADPHPVT